MNLQIGNAQSAKTHFVGGVPSGVRMTEMETGQLLVPSVAQWGSTKTGSHTSTNTNRRRRPWFSGSPFLLVIINHRKEKKW